MRFIPKERYAALCIAGDSECSTGWPKTAAVRVDPSIEVNPESECEGDPEAERFMRERPACRAG
jgi:hypothetical protein